MLFSFGDNYSSSRTRTHFATKGELTRFSPYYIRSKIIGTLHKLIATFSSSCYWITPFTLCSPLICTLKSHVLPLDKFNPLQYLWDFVPAPPLKICTPLRDKEDASFKSFHSK